MKIRLIIFTKKKEYKNTWHTSVHARGGEGSLLFVVEQMFKFNRFINSPAVRSVFAKPWVLLDDDDCLLVNFLSDPSTK